jgi:hypothetical protein
MRQRYAPRAPAPKQRPAASCGEPLHAADVTVEPGPGGPAGDAD